MGIADALSDARDYLARKLWEQVRDGASGEVLDSVRGPVRCSGRDADRTLVIVGAALPLTEVPFARPITSARIGERPVELRSGRRALRRASFGATVHDGVAVYRLRQRGRRRADVQREGRTLASLGRPPGGPRTVTWTAEATPDEAALTHALAAYAGIGAPGFVANIARSIGP